MKLTYIRKTLNCPYCGFIIVIPVLRGKPISMKISCDKCGQIYHVRKDKIIEEDSRFNPSRRRNNFEENLENRIKL